MRLPAAIFHRPQDPAVRVVWRINQMYWLCVLFIGGYGLLRVFNVGGTDPPVNVPLFAGAVVLAALDLLLRTRRAVRRGDRHRSRPSWHTLANLLLVTMGIRATGAIQSPLWVVLFVIIIVETVLASTASARMVRWAAGVALFVGIAPLPMQGGYEYGNGAWFLDFVTRLFFLVVVSIVARRLRVQASTFETALRTEIAATEERAKLSREVHDDVGNTLAATVLRLEVTARVQAKQHGDGDAIAQMLREEATCLREAMNRVRDWTFLARSWPVVTADGVGTRPAEMLTREVSRLGQRTGVPMRADGCEHLDDLPETTRLAALRIIQEALTNAAKHAEGATEVSATLKREGRWLVVTVADDGCGMDGENDAKSLVSVGLASMRERAEALGGTFLLQSAPSLGVTIVARLPIL